MAQKPIPISLIAALVVAGILILCPLATKPLTNQAFAATPCSLTVSANPSSGSIGWGEKIDSTISGTLTCGGTGLGGAKIDFTTMYSYSITDSSGNYDKVLVCTYNSCEPFIVKVHYAGDSEHSAADASTTVNMTHHGEAYK